MRMHPAHTGTIKTWNNERGFGFIAPDQGSSDVFLHIKAWPLPTLPEVGDRVQYQLMHTDDGKLRAAQVSRLQGPAHPLTPTQDTRDAQTISRVATSKSAQHARQHHTQRPIASASSTPHAKAARTSTKAPPRKTSDSRSSHKTALWSWVAVGTLLALLGFACFQGRIELWLPIGYGLMSLATFAVYAHDKRAAQQNAWRVPENNLLLLGLCCGWPGALLAQHLLRHKSSKTAFLLPFWITVLLNLGALAWLSQR